MIVVAGLPRSGNNIIRLLILRCFKEKEKREKGYQGERVVVWHGMGGIPQTFLTPRRPLRVIVPVRNPRCQRLSERFKLKGHNFPEGECRRGLFQLVYERRAPVKFVSYEAFCEDHDAVARDLIDWLGLPYHPFDEGYIVHGNPKYDGVEE